MENIDVKTVNINGCDTFYIDGKDTHGNFLFINIPENADYNFSDFANQFIDGHLIKEINYTVVEGKRYIKAYY